MKKYQTLGTLVATLTIIGSLTGGANAAVTQIFDPTGLALENDFETTVNTSRVSFESGAYLFGAAGASGGVTTSGVNGLTIDQTSLAGTIAIPQVNEMGFFFGNDDAGGGPFSVILEVFAGGSSLGQVSVNANGNDFVDQFIGVNSDMPFDSFVITYDQGALDPFIDDLHVTVPEPSSAMLLGFGMLGGLARRSRRAS